MNSRLLRITLFLTWILCITLVPAKVLRSRVVHELADQSPPSINERLVQKLYTRLHTEMAKNETEFKVLLAQLTDHQREIDLRIAEAQRKLVELRQATAVLAQNSEELNLNKKYLMDRARESPIYRTPETERKIDDLGLRLNTNYAQIQQYANTMKELSGEIDRLSQYSLSTGAGWYRGNPRLKSIPEAKQYYYLELTKAQSELRLTEEKYSAWRSSSDRDPRVLLSYLIAYAADQGVICSVDIISQQGTNFTVETTDATVRYQTPEQRQYGASPKSAKSTTKCLGEKIKPNRYYMWTERGGTATSSRDELFPIAEAQEKVTLIER